MKSFLAVSAVGKDRSGIVAGLTRVLLELGGNLEDSSMTRLKNDFAILLLVALPEGVDPSQASGALDREAKALGLTIIARVLEPDEWEGKAPRTGSTYTLVLYGADKPGLVHRVSEMAAKTGLNIIDLRSQLSGTENKPVYSMVLELDAPDAATAERFKVELGRLQQELKVDLVFSPSEADEL
jgi:glycine cleavage system transcriptional repressor